MAAATLHGLYIWSILRSLDASCSRPWFKVGGHAHTLHCMYFWTSQSFCNARTRSFHIDELIKFIFLVSFCCTVGISRLHKLHTCFTKKSPQCAVAQIQINSMAKSTNAAEVRLRKRTPPTSNSKCGVRPQRRRRVLMRHKDTDDERATEMDNEDADLIQLVFSWASFVATNSGQLNDEECGNDNVFWASTRYGSLITVIVLDMRW